MSKRITAKTFAEKSVNNTIIDVRSPLEFKQGHMPGAINIPLFSDEERAKVGTAYKQQGGNAAMLLGLEIVGPKMKELVLQAQKVAKDNTLFIYCWRGGQRSQSVAWLFEKANLDTFVLEGGYKAYRSYFKNQFSQIRNMLILSGNTGSGKTDILKKMSELGEQIVDLEGLAHHKGSAFGSIGESEQLSTEQFENNLFHTIKTMDFTLPIWVEDESKAIGKNHIPDEFFRVMRSAPVIKIDLDKSIRINRLQKEYTQVSKEVLIFHLNRIRKRLGPLETKIAIEAVENGDMAKAIDQTLVFYDKAYAYGLSKRDVSKIFTIELNSDNPTENARQIIKFSKSNLNNS